MEFVKVRTQANIRTKSSHPTLALKCPLQYSRKPIKMAGNTVMAHNAALIRSP